MLQRHAAPVLIKVAKDFDEDHLGEIFFARPAWQVRSHEFENKRIKAMQQLARSGFVAPLHPQEAILFVKVVIMHWN